MITLLSAPVHIRERERTHYRSETFIHNRTTTNRKSENFPSFFRCRVFAKDLAATSEFTLDEKGVPEKLPDDSPERWSNYVSKTRHIFFQFLIIRLI